MTENLLQGKKENQSQIHFVLQLEESRLGDQKRLESIKKTLSTGTELPEVDKQYLEEQSAQLQKAFGHELMAKWTMDFVQKLQEKEKKKSFTIEEIKDSLEKEKNKYKIDKKFLKHASTQLKQSIEHERETEVTLDLISQLKETKIGDNERLQSITKLIKSGQNLEEGDKQYLKEKSGHLRQVVDCKTKVTKTKEAIKKLQENEIKHVNKLEQINQSVENGKLISEREQNYLNARYERFQSALDQQNKIEWTIKTIHKLEESRIGDSAKFDKIKELLEDEIPVSENDTIYLKEEYKLLQQIQKHKKKIDWTRNMITELQEIEIGNSERLSTIKKLLEERRPIPETEINYLTQKCRLLMMTKNSEKEYETTNNENNSEESDYNFILSELNTIITELEKLEQKFQVSGL
jgi:hypothetical protein